MLELPDELVPDPVLPAVLPDVLPPVVPAVDPDVEPVRLEPDELPLDMLAFVRMNDAVFPLPDAERDALVPDVEVPLVEPVVPVAPLPSPCWRQPTTVIVPLCEERFVPLCCDPEVVWSLPVCAATIAVNPTPIANIHAARFIRPPVSSRSAGAIARHSPPRTYSSSPSVTITRGA
jgi:hypothetical protein